MSHVEILIMASLIVVVVFINDIARNWRAMPSSEGSFLRLILPYIAIFGIFGFALPVLWLVAIAVLAVAMLAWVYRIFHPLPSQRALERNIS